MDTSRRVFFGALAGGIVVAPMVAAFRPAAKTERELLVEKLMVPLTWAEGEEPGLNHVRIGTYLGLLVKWCGWTGRFENEECYARGRWIACKGVQLVLSSPSSVTIRCAPYIDYLTLIKVRRAALDILLDRVEWHAEHGASLATLLSGGLR